MVHLIFHTMNEINQDVYEVEKMFYRIKNTFKKWHND